MSDDFFHFLPTAKNFKNTAILIEKIPVLCYNNKEKVCLQRFFGESATSFMLR